MLISLLIGILLGIAFFLFPILIGITLFFLLIKKIRDGFSNREEDW